MNKVYKATNFYYFKIAVVIVIIAFVAFSYTTFFASLFGFNSLANTVFVIVFGSVSLFAIYVVILSNKPVITFENDAFRYRYKKILFSEIQSYHPPLGGSEPYLITKEGKKIDLELSWLKKQDQQEIQEILLSHIGNE